jgi:hypothetical protein
VPSAIDPAHIRTPIHDEACRLRWLRSIAPSGSIRFRHWRLYAERGLAGERAAVWVHGETLTLEYETETVARYRATLEADGRLKEVGDPRFFVTGHNSPQPFLPGLEEVDWQPAQRLPPYRARRTRAETGLQEPLFAGAHGDEVVSSHLVGGGGTQRSTSGGRAARPSG